MTPFRHVNEKRLDIFIGNLFNQSMLIQSFHMEIGDRSSRRIRQVNRKHAFFSAFQETPCLWMSPRGRLEPNILGIQLMLLSKCKRMLTRFRCFCDLSFVAEDKP